jgi:hypothetical protein
LWANYGGEEMNRLAAAVLKGKEKPQSELRLGKEQSEARQDEGFGGLSQQYVLSTRRRHA